MHDAQIRVAIAGAGGRMGRQLIQAAIQMDGVALGAALEREGSSLRERPASPYKAAWTRLKMTSMCSSILPVLKGRSRIWRFAVSTARGW